MLRPVEACGLVGSEATRSSPLTRLPCAVSNRQISLPSNPVAPTTRIMAFALIRVAYEWSRPIEHS